MSQIVTDFVNIFSVRIHETCKKPLSDVSPELQLECVQPNNGLAQSPAPCVPLPPTGTFGGVLRGPSAGVGRLRCASGLRARCRVGLRWFIDLHVTMNGSYTLNESHAATEAIEKAIQATISTADVTIHVEPAEAAVVKPRPLQGRGRREKRNTKQVRDER